MKSWGRKWCIVYTFSYTYRTKIQQERAKAKLIEKDMPQMMASILEIDRSIHSTRQHADVSYQRNTKSDKKIQDLQAEVKKGTQIARPITYQYTSVCKYEESAF